MLGRGWDAFVEENMPYMKCKPFSWVEYGGISVSGAGTPLFCAENMRTMVGFQVENNAFRRAQCHFLNETLAIRSGATSR